NLFFAFILLIALFVTNAIPLEKSSTDFSNLCIIEGHFVGAISASVSPDPVISEQSVNFKVSRTLNYSVTDKELIYIGFFNALGSLIEDYNNSTAPRTEAGCLFNANPTFEAPANLPNQYYIRVLVAKSK
ncbi:12067_t:CDS:1, partial [Dentiscutata erythropus]